MNNVVEHHHSEGIWVSFDDEAVSDGNFIIGNTIRDHDQPGEGVGIRVYSNDNLIYHNNLINNFFSASDDGHNNCWDHDGEGNYWSDYTGQDENGDGIGDTPYLVAPNGVDNYPLMTPYTYNPAPDIKANDSDEPITISPEDTLIVTVSLDPNDVNGEDADWWVVADTPFDWYHYDVGSGSWIPGLVVSYQGPLFDLTPPFEVLNMSGLPTGAYTFYFGVDMVMNGSLDMDQIYYDSVEVNVE